MVLKNRRVLTIDNTDSIARAIALKDGLIQAVGSGETIGALGGLPTQIIDVGGRVVTPGLIDPHLRYELFGLLNTFYKNFVPPEVRTMEQLQSKLAEVAAQTLKGEWIEGDRRCGRLPIARSPTKASPLSNKLLIEPEVCPGE
jgi:predicted amidohydrolase YtcJ